MIKCKISKKSVVMSTLSYYFYNPKSKLSREAHLLFLLLWDALQWKTSKALV